MLEDLEEKRKNTGNSVRRHLSAFHSWGSSESKLPGAWELYRLLLGMGSSLAFPVDGETLSRWLPAQPEFILSVLPSLTFE